MIEIDEYLLCNFEDNRSFFERNSELWNCNWKSLIEKDIFLKNFIKNKLTFEDEEDTTKNVDKLLLSGVTCLLAFVQDNFTGPDLAVELNEFLGNIWPTDLKAIDLLSVDGEEINTNVKNPELLLMSKIIFENLYDNFDYSFITQWWLIRIIFVHQKVLDAPTFTLYEKFLNITEKTISTINTIEDIKLQSILLLEIVQGYLLFRRFNKAEDTLNLLIEMLGVDLHVEGVLGVRTKFQQKALPQLLLKVKYEESVQFDSSVATHGDVELPKLLKLDDDVRLEKVTFMEKEENTVMELSSVLQSLILAKLKLLQLAQPKGTLAEEEFEPYLTSLLYQKNGPLAIRRTALLTKVQLESAHKRTVDRSLKQCEQLVQSITESLSPVRDRISFIFTSSMCSRWAVEAQLCDIMLSLGLVKTALDIYLRLQMWEEVICCYTLLDLRHKAADIIQQEIDKKPTVKLYCLLGDATDSVDRYEQAWKLSNERSGRAQRHWGNFYFAKKQYQECIPHLQKSLEINSLQEVVYLRLGYAALALEQWDIAAKAYRRYTQLEPHGFESWNNLAKAYIKLGDKHRAHKILQESLKCNYNNWRVWENYLFVSIDTGYFEDAINAFNRLLELKNKFYDKSVLNILVNAIVNNIPDANGIPSSRLIKKLQTLLGHVCIQQTNDGLVWELAAKLQINDYFNKAQKLQKAYRGYTQLSTSTSWSKNPETCEKVIQLCLELSSASLDAVKNMKENEKAGTVSQLSSARLSCQGCLRAATDEKWPNCEKYIIDLQNYLEIMSSQLKQLL